MTLFRCALLLLAVVAALGTTGESQTIAWVIAAATATSLVQSVLFHRRLSQLIHPEWDDGIRSPTRRIALTDFPGRFKQFGAS